MPQFFQISWRLLKKQRPRMLIGIFGILVTSFLTTSVAILNDSLAYYSLQTVISQIGEGDVFVSKQNPLDPSTDLYFIPTTLEESIQDISEVQDITYRILDVVNYDSSVSHNRQFLACMGINFTHERALGFESWQISGTNQDFIGQLQPGHVLITKALADQEELLEGDTLEVRLRQGGTFEIVVDKIVVRKLGTEIISPAMIVFDLSYLQAEFVGEGAVNVAIIRIENSQELYNSRNIPQSLAILREIGVKIGLALPEEYDYYLPKYLVLEESEFIFIPFSVLYWFLLLFTIIIAALLIYGLVLTSSEELIYDFGILRTLGGKKPLIFGIVLFIGIFMTIVGSSIGTLLSISFTPLIISPISDLLNLNSMNIPIVYIPENIAQATLILSAITVIISLLPAYKVYGQKITDSLSPFRKDDSTISFQKTGTPNKRSLLVGLVISVLGILFFLVLPIVIAYLNFFLVAMIFVVLLMLMLIGFSLVLINLIGPLEYLLHQSAAFVSKKIKKTLNLSIHELHISNNKDLIQKISITLSFTFIFFITNMVQVLPQITQETLEFQYGSEIIISNKAATNPLDQDFIETLENIPGVESIAPIYTNSYDFNLLINFEINSLFSSQNYSAQASDLIGYHSQQIGLVGVSDSYLETIDPEQINMPNYQDAFDQVFSQSNSAILSAALADDLNLEKGDSFRLTISSNFNSKTQIHEFIVAGISSGMPGFWNFRQGFYSVYLQPGLMVSEISFLNLTGYNASESLSYDKILINTLPDVDVNEMQTRIQSYIESDADYLIDNSHSKLASLISFFDTLTVIFSIILFFGVVISLFSLYSNALRLIQEKQREFGVLETLGLHRDSARNYYIRNLFFRAVASALLGTLFGLFLANFIKFELAYIIEIPFSAYIPWKEIGIILTLTFLLGGAGSYGIIRAKTNKSITEFLLRFN